MVTLEWLMIVAAASVLAVSTALIVHQAVDGHTEAPADPLVRVVQADIAAADVAADATALWEQRIYTDVDDSMFEARCETEILADFRDVVDRSDWTSPNGGPARCTVRPSAGLGR